MVERALRCRRTGSASARGADASGRVPYPGRDLIHVVGMPRSRSTRSLKTTATALAFSSENTAPVQGVGLLVTAACMRRVPPFREPAPPG
jgi:hypothetical protein